MKLGALLLLSAWMLYAQPPFEIRGSVIEPGLGGIAGAEVRARIPNNAIPPQNISVFTDARGEFVIHTSIPGAYFLQPERDGYVPPIMSDASVRVVTVDVNHPSGSTQLAMHRPAEITGRVLDAETREPIAGVDIFILQKGANSNWSETISVSSTSILGNASAKTDSRGNFAAKGLLPGSYVASPIRPQGATWNAEYSPGDLKVVDQTPEVLFWPGGTPPEIARPIPAGSGAVVSFGDILLKKVPHYRAHVSLEQGSCPSGESMRISVSGQHLPDQQPKAFPCGTDLLLRDLMPGTYHLYAVSDWQGLRDNLENASWASADFVIDDRNAEIALIPRAGIVLEGQFIAGEGIPLPDASAMGVRPLATEDGFQPGVEQFVDIQEGGKFRIAVAPKPQTLRGDRYRDSYAREIRYNGTPLRGLRLDVNPGASAQRLEVFLDNKYGALTGTMTGGERTARAVVALWSEGAEYPIQARVTNGTFQMPALTPGEYLVSVGVESFGTARPGRKANRDRPPGRSNYHQRFGTGGIKVNMPTRAILFLAATVAFAQTYEIRGTVTEQGGSGVAEAEVNVLRIEDGAKLTAKTDGQGAFRLTVDQPGTYMTGATKPGYIAAGSAPIVASNTP